MTTLMTVDDVAGLLKLKSRTVRGYIYKGGIMPSHLKIGGSIRFRREDISNWLNINQPQDISDRPEVQVKQDRG